MTFCGSKRRRTEAENFYSTGPLSFYRILVPESQFQAHIEIPRKFARYCFGAMPILPVKATLRVPGGVSWSATMTKRGDHLFLSDEGWEEFVKACTLQAYDILIFIYDGISVFDVRILDKKYCSKEVLKYIHKEISQAGKEFGEKTDVSSTANTLETTPIHTLESSCDSYGSIKKPSLRDDSGALYAYRAGKEAAVKMANEYMTCKQMNDSSFSKVLRPTHVSEPCIVYFPKAWFSKYLTQKIKKVYLRLGNKTWMLEPTYNHNKGTGRCVGGGWRQFVEHNHLENFDVCVLSFVTKNDDVAEVDVSIFQGRTTTVTPLTQASITSCEPAPYEEANTYCDLDPHEETNTYCDLDPHEETNTYCDLDQHEEINTYCDLDQHEETAMSSNLTPYEAKDTSFDPPPFRATEMSSSSFFYHFERLWRNFPAEKLVQSTYFEWFHFERYQLGKSDVLPSIKKKNIFSRNYVFVPILRWGHWNLLILCHFDKSLDSKNKNTCMLLLDSLHMADPRRLEKDIREFVFNIYMGEGILLDPRVSQIPLLIPKVPQQKSDECGYFSLYFIKKFMETVPQDGDMSFINENWFTRDEFEAFCIALNNDAPQEMSFTRRIMQRRRCKRPFSSKGDDDAEVIVID